MKKFKIIATVLAALLFLFTLCFVACGETTTTPAPNINSNTATDGQVPSESSTQTEAFEMEKVDKSSEGQFSFYRDTTTDVVYIQYREKAGYSGMGGLTVMLDPSTGLPLTYARYMEIYHGQQF